MEAFLLEKLGQVTEEERRLLAGGEPDPRLYGGGADFTVESGRLIREGNIAIRPHTRYAPFPLHRHNFLEMVIVLRGEITHRIGPAALRLLPGDILFLNKHIAHSVDRTDTEDLGVNFVLSDGFVNRLVPELQNTVFAELTRENMREEGHPMYLHFSSAGNKQIENLVENLLFEMTEYTHADEQVLTRTVALLFHYLSLKSRELLRDGSSLPDRDALRRQQIRAYLGEHYREGTLTALAEQLYLSPPYLSKTVSRLFGKNFKQLLCEAREEQAERLLRETDMPVSEIIGYVGYDNESYFHRRFRVRTGTTPGRYRKEHRGTVGE